MMGWAPAEGMRTIGGQLGELLWVEIPLVPWLKDGKRLSEEEVNERIGSEQDFEGLRKKLVETRAATLEYLDSLSEEELAEEVPCGDAWFGTFWPASLPRAELFLNVSEHEFYHVGQLTSYLWSRGDDPYKW